MAFCSKGFSDAKKFLSKIDDDLKIIIDVTTEYTGKIKDLEASPAVDAIVKILPYGTPVIGWLNKGLDVLLGVEQTAKTLEVRLSEWLAGKTDADKNGSLFKLASVSTAIAAGNKEKESFYDTAVQVHIQGLK